jgi:FAD/FMN-containing dehydrogenase
MDKEAGPNVLTVGILHHKMVNVLAFDEHKLTMRVGAGMQLNHLLAAADAHDVSVVPGTLPAYAGLTVGGIIAGGAHGTGDQALSNPVSHTRSWQGVHLPFRFLGCLNPDMGEGLRHWSVVPGYYLAHMQKKEDTALDWS